MKDCRNCANLEFDYKHRECYINPELHEKWWNHVQITGKTDAQLEKDFEGLVPFWCWKEKSEKDLEL